MKISGRNLLAIVLLSSVMGGLTVYLLIELLGTGRVPAKTYFSIAQRQESRTLSTGVSRVNPSEGLDFRTAAEQVLPAVVHIQTYYGEGASSNPLDALFNSQARSSGSGVIISDDGYIATNRHVIEDADKIEVILHDNRSYIATLIGQDETTDLALLRIEAKNLPFVKYGDSDAVAPGDWVLAVGNPFDLNSTVTAGIVSAKARNIGILRSRTNLQIESFIQTDAAVNPGNSGGALVNLDGELVGINTAIATQTGSYQGYSFAVPVTLVSKVMDDLLEFGEVKRGLLGIVINDVNARVAEAYDLDVVNGVLIRSVNDNGAGNEAGLEAGDVIIGVNGKVVTNTSELQEFVARNRPGDQVEIIFLRNNTEMKVNVILRDFYGAKTVSRTEKSNILEGAHFSNLGEDAGVEIEKLEDGIFKDSGFATGDVISHIDKARVHSVGELLNTLEGKTGPVMIEGFDSKGKRFIRALDW